MKKMGIGLFWLFVCSVHAQNAVPPPNRPALVRQKGNAIEIVYEDEILFKGTIQADGSGILCRENTMEMHGTVTQLILLCAADRRTSIALQGHVCAGPESFPCESDPPFTGLTVVRHSSGQSRSLRNRAVYDRGRDWVFSIDPYARCSLEPERSVGEARRYAVGCSGNEIILRFRPRFFQKHRGLSRFEPWTYRIWPEPVAGWCSWFAFFSDIRESDVIETADVLSETLLPFGYEYLQIDDGYQRGEGLPDLWLDANEKFPNGLRALAEYIAKKNLKPAIWTNVAFKDRDFAGRHRGWFVLDREGIPAEGNWIGLSLDAANEEAADSVIRPLYRTLMEMGWTYFKVDALRHLRYEGYNSHSDYFRLGKNDLEDTYRHYVEVIREEVGTDRFILGCWGIRPELVGLIDGCRLGTDGFSFAGLSQFNSFNNVVWRNDPDHIVLSEQEAWRSTMVTSLTGSLMLLTDTPDTYRTPIIEPAKRASPVLFTTPGQMYDVDPSRSMHMDRAGAEVSGSGPRILDAGGTPACHLYALEIDRPFENWLVLGRTGGEFDAILFDELGLNPDQEYLVFEFWSRTYWGSFTRSFCPGKLPEDTHSQVFIIRQRKNVPQLLATGRHLTGGGVDVLELEWKNNTLTGQSQVTGKDPYPFYLFVPRPYRLVRFECDGHALQEIETDGRLIVVRYLPEISKKVRWSALFHVESHQSNAGGAH